MGGTEIGTGLFVAGAVVLVGGLLLFVVARRALKFMVRLVIFVVLVVALLLGGVVFWFASPVKPAGNAPASRPSNSRPRPPK